MNPEKASLNAAVFRNTAKDPTWLGYWLARHQQTEDLDEQQLAAKLEVSMDNLVLLCLCRKPRDEQFKDDLRIICQRTGAKEQELAQLLRQEQTLLSWGKPSARPGRLMAASDRPDDETKPESKHDQ